MWPKATNILYIFLRPAVIKKKILYRNIIDFKKGYQPLTNVVKYKKG